jgi:aminoglycoside 3-N-acetyltransferase I
MLPESTMKVGNFQNAKKNLLAGLYLSLLINKMNSKNIHIQQLGKSDLLLFRELITLFNEVFEEKRGAVANETYLKQLLQRKEFIVFVALQNDNVIGGLTAYEMPMYSAEHSELYIYDMAVKTEFQRMGIGKNLISALSGYAKANNIKTMFVEAHEEDTHAIDFYHSANGKAGKVVHFNFEII